MRVIYDDVKANRPVNMERFEHAAGELRGAEAVMILLGCAAVQPSRQAIGVDVMQLMAKVSVEQCGKLKQEFTELITI